MSIQKSESSGAKIAPETVIDDRYRIARQLGEEGATAVYEAAHVASGRRMVVRVLHASPDASPEWGRRFSRAARAAAEIGPTPAVDVVDSGTHRGAPYLVTETAPGETLRARVARVHKLSAASSVEVVGCVLSALASVHARGVVHRDLKPDNVFLVEPNDTEARGETVRLLDFGASKYQPSRESYVDISSPPPLLGTPAYRSPEQWLGRRDLDARADLFSVGVMLYELLTGALPFGDGTAEELFERVVCASETPTAPSAIDPTLPEALDDVVLRAIQRDRDARFPTAQRLLHALHPFGARTLTSVDLSPMARTQPVTQEQ